MTDPSEPDPQPADRRDRSVRARRKARAAKIARENHIVALLNRGASIPEIAARVGVSPDHMHKLVRKVLAQRMPLPPAEYLALQVSRLNEALLVTYGEMHTSVTGTNFEAVDRVVRIVRELDRYHGFSAASAPRAEPEPRRLPPPAHRPLALEPPRAISVLGLETPLAERVQNGAASD